MQIMKSDFFSAGVRCAGDLYLPDGIDKPPVVILAHGMTGQKNFRLPAYAARFVARGIAAFLFDYRTFGDSDGHPRHNVNPYHHVRDWQAAMAHVGELPAVDGKHPALWGTSFSGGHIIVAAAGNPRVAALVSQVPFVSGLASMRLKSVGDQIRSTLHATADLMRAALSLAPDYTPSVGPPGTFAAMNTAESWTGFQTLIPEDTKWENKLTSRSFLWIPFYNPLKFAPRVKAPCLLMGAVHDSLIPIAAVRKMAGKLPDCEFIEMPCNHFEPYTGTHFEEFAARQADFLEHHLITLRKERG